MKKKYDEWTFKWKNNKWLACIPFSDSNNIGTYKKHGKYIFKKVAAVAIQITETSFCFSSWKHVTQFHNIHMRKFK